MKKLRNGCLLLALALSHAMCAAVAYACRDLMCGISHLGYSAPAGTAFLYAAPFAIPILLLCISAAMIHRKIKRTCR